MCNFIEREFRKALVFFMLFSQSPSQLLFLCLKGLLFVDQGQVSGSGVYYGGSLVKILQLLDVINETFFLMYIPLHSRHIGITIVVRRG